MPFVELALLFSLSSIFMLGLTGWYNFRKLWLNLAPYVSIILAFWFYYLGDDGIEFEFIAVSLPAIALLHALMYYDERKKK